MKKSAIAVLVALASFSATADWVEVTHLKGTTKVESQPERVVVLGMGALDTVHSFGIEPVAIAKVSMYPEYLAQYRDGNYVTAGSLFEPDFETIFTQKPDLIIVGSRGASKYKELSEIAPTIVFAADDKKGYWQSTQEQWRNLAKVFNKQDFVEKKISELDNEFKAIRDYNQKNSVDALTVMSSGGNVTTFGAQSRFSAIYKDFGFKETVEGIKESRHGDLISYEFIREANPTTLLIIDRDKLVNKGTSKTRESFENDLVKATDAYQNKHMAYLDINAWYLSISGLKATEQMIDDIQGSIGLN